MKKLPKAKFWSNASFPIGVAHRGGDAAGVEKENSMPAFKAAYDLGYRWFETDVVPTKDGKLLAIHGRGYQRHPNKDLPSRLKIQKLTYEEVRKTIKIGGESPVLLDELLDTFTDVKFFLDPKTIKAASVLARKLTNRPQDLDRVLIGSFIPFNNARVYRAVKKATGDEIGLALLGPLKAWPIKIAKHASLLKAFARLYIRWTRTSSVHIPYKWVMNKTGHEIVHTSHELGLKVGVYTPNRRVDIEQAITLGVDIVMSDNIEFLKASLKP